MLLMHDPHSQKKLTFTQDLQRAREGVNWRDRPSGMLVPASSPREGSLETLVSPKPGVDKRTQLEWSSQQGPLGDLGGCCCYEAPRWAQKGGTESPSHFNQNCNCSTRCFQVKSLSEERSFQLKKKIRWKTTLEQPDSFQRCFPYLDFDLLCSRAAGPGCGGGGVFGRGRLWARGGAGGFDQRV